VALSGDGADELFGGYNKHRAEWIMRHRSGLTTALKMIAPVTGVFAGSRQSKSGNLLRQINRFAEGAGMSAQERYWRWCSLAAENDAMKLLTALPGQERKTFSMRRNAITNLIDGGHDMNDVFRADFNMVLAGDMLVKVDMMSMANSLEVRNPFLDADLVNFVFRLPSHYKIDNRSQKKILKETFAHLLPEKIQKRGKKGFEVPLLKWFRSGLKSKIENEWLQDDFIREQGVFNADEIKKLKQQLYASHPGEAVARVWALIVFQHWWIKNKMKAN
jgi:asparagine synthase (glutamine-hydrolysing)